MCGPLAMFAVGAASSVMEFAGQQQDYKAQKAQWTQNYVNALSAGRDEQKQLTDREMQEQDALVQKNHLSLLDQAKAESEALVAAQADGVSGQGVDLLIRDVQNEALQKRTTNDENYRNTAMQLTNEKKGAVAKMQDRINSVAAPRKPGIGGMLLGIAGAGVKAYGSM